MDQPLRYTMRDFIHNVDGIGLLNPLLMKLSSIH